MPLKTLFGGFEPDIRESFLAAKNAAGGAVSGVDLQIEEEPYSSPSVRAEFLVFPPAGPVRVTWGGIASLWAFSQGAGRLSRRMFEGKRSGQTSLLIKSDPEAERGLDSLEMARRLLKSDIPVASAVMALWPDWAPPIVISPAEDSDNYFGNRLFSGALAFILRHELAHLFLDHGKRLSKGLTRKAAEIEADRQATVWLRAHFQADQTREAGSKPDTSEIALEARAVGIGIGLIWVALFENELTQRSKDYPPAADRFFSCLKELGLREDSFAAEVLSDIIQVWIAPQEKWSPPGGYPTAADALNDATERLRQHLG